MADGSVAGCPVSARYASNAFLRGPVHCAHPSPPLPCVTPPSCIPAVNPADSCPKFPTMPEACSLLKSKSAIRFFITAGAWASNDFPALNAMDGFSAARVAPLASLNSLAWSFENFSVYPDLMFASSVGDKFMDDASTPKFFAIFSFASSIASCNPELNISVISCALRIRDFANSASNFACLSSFVTNPSPVLACNSRSRFSFLLRSSSNAPKFTPDTLVSSTPSASSVDSPIPSTFLDILESTSFNCMPKSVSAGVTLVFISLPKSTNAFNACFMVTCSAPVAVCGTPVVALNLLLSILIVDFAPIDDFVSAWTCLTTLSNWSFVITASGPSSNARITSPPGTLLNKDLSTPNVPAACGVTADAWSDSMRALSSARSVYNPMLSTKFATNPKPIVYPSFAFSMASWSDFFFSWDASCSVDISPNLANLSSNPSNILPVNFPN